MNSRKGLKNPVVIQRPEQPQMMGDQEKVYGDVGFEIRVDVQKNINSEGLLLIIKLMNIFVF